MAYNRHRRVLSPNSLPTRLSGFTWILLTFLWQEVYHISWWIAGPVLALWVMLLMLQIFVSGSEKQVDIFPEDEPKK